MMGIAERTATKKPTVGQRAGERMDHAHFERFVDVERRQQAGKALGEHRLARTRGADHQHDDDVETPPAAR